MEPRKRNFRKRFLLFSFLKIFLSFLFIFLSVIYISFKRWFLILFFFLSFSTTASKNPKLCSDVVGHGEIVYSSIELIKTHESGALSEQRHSSSRQNQRPTGLSSLPHPFFRSDPKGRRHKRFVEQVEAPLDSRPSTRPLRCRPPTHPSSLQNLTSKQSTLPP